MEIIEIQVEHASGLCIRDRATFDPASGVIHVSDGFQEALRAFGIPRQQFVASATIGGVAYPMSFCLGGEPVECDFYVERFDATLSLRHRSVWADPWSALGRWNREQWQQFGRFCHTLSLSAFVSAIGLWHSTEDWSWSSRMTVVGLFTSAVLSFFIGIVSFKGGKK